MTALFKPAQQWRVAAAITEAKETAYRVYEYLTRASQNLLLNLVSTDTTRSLRKHSMDTRVTREEKVVSLFSVSSLLPDQYLCRPLEHV
eukprot:739877-Hanusia_phi.AAC.3